MRWTESTVHLDFKVDSAVATVKRPFANRYLTRSSQTRRVEAGRQHEALMETGARR